MSGEIPIAQEHLTTETAYTRLKELADRCENSTFLKTSRLLYEIPDNEIDAFKAGVVSQEEMYPLLMTKLREDRSLLDRHFNKLSSATRARIANNVTQNLPENLLTKITYEIISSIHSKERRNFCVTELGAQPQNDSWHDCSVSQKLKLDMSDWWWENIANRSTEELKNLLIRAEQFFADNEDCVSKKHVENMIVGCRNFQILQGFNLQ